MGHLEGTCTTPLLQHASSSFVFFRKVEGGKSGHGLPSLMNVASCFYQGMTEAGQVQWGCIS